ncbi:MAG: hypothetical protein LBD46_04170 [Endomicrobium sp.]|jgi:hypothetical protein|nr:hypothetical protein [Endomicrobium sp.]
MIRHFILFVLLISLSACYGVSYPKGDIIGSLEALIKKESGTDCKAYVVGKSLYLDMPLEGLTSKDQNKVNDAIKKMQNAVMAITRVTLSSDSDIKYMVVSAFSPEKSVSFRILQNIDDVKSYLYMRISRGDYESRNLFEIEGPEMTAVLLEDRHDITDNEYVGRMIVSQINMAARTNPFLGALISMLQLRYSDVKDGVLYISLSGTMDNRVKEFAQNMIVEETKKYSQKYALDFTRVIILDNNKRIVLDIDFSEDGAQS